MKKMYCFAAVLAAVLLSVAGIAGAEDAAKALLAKGSSLTVFFDDKDEDAVPWEIDDDCLMAASADMDGSYAMVYVGLTAADGDVLSFDAKVSCEAMYDYLCVSLDGKAVKVLDGKKDWASYAVQLTEGEHTVSFAYQKGASVGGTDDAAWIKNVKVVFGDEAAALTAAMPVFPHALASGMSVVLDDAAAKEIVFEYAYPEYADTAALALGNAYIIDSDTAVVKLYIGADVNPETAAVYNDADGSFIRLSEADIDGDAFAVGITGLSHSSRSTLTAYCNLYDEESDTIAVTLFSSEESVNAFIDEMNAGYDQIVFVSWLYADTAEAM